MEEHIRALLQRFQYSEQFKETAVFRTVNLFQDKTHALGPVLSTRQLVFLDENRRNEAWITPIGVANKAGFRYEVWATDHPFSNKRLALTKTVLDFLGK